MTRGEERKPRSLQGQASELGVARLRGFNSSRRTHSEIPHVEFKGKQALRHLAIADKQKEEMVNLGGAIIADILWNNKGQVRSTFRHT